MGEGSRSSDVALPTGDIHVQEQGPRQEMNSPQSQSPIIALQYSDATT